jgi:hypothetical protein
MDVVAELRTGSNGRFTIPNVPAGTRQVEVLAIGMSPVVIPVDVSPNETASIGATMRRVTTLDVVRVTGSRRTMLVVSEFESRRKNGAGYVRDSSQIAANGTMASVFFAFPSLQVERGSSASSFWLSLPGGARGRCVANLWIDDVLQRDMDLLTFLRPSEIAAVEVYPRVFNTPNKYMGVDMCGSVVIWTKRTFQ